MKTNAQSNETLESYHSMTFIFRELKQTYGVTFLNQYKSKIKNEHGKDTGLINTLITWEKKLKEFICDKQVINYVLGNLPKNPPNLLQFYELCKQATARKDSYKIRDTKKLTAEELENRRLTALKHIKNMKDIMANRVS